MGREDGGTMQEQRELQQAAVDDGFVSVLKEGDLGDGEMTAVLVDDLRVLVANVGGQYFAIDAICTHERANLDQGTLHEGVVYCPLHYSAFDVRSGAALSPPAEQATSAYPVKVENGSVKISVHGGSAPPEVASGAGASAATAEEHPAERRLPWHAQLGEAIDSLRWLQRVTAVVFVALTAVRKRLTPSRLVDFLHGRWLGHSLHPALSDVPIGLWIGALLLYLLGMPDAGVILSVIGTASALGAAVTGVTDLSVAEGHERRAGVLHGLLMTAAMIIHLASAAAFYLTGSVIAAVALTAVGLLITTFGAYLGGHLVFGHGTMVNHTSWPAGPAQWVRVLEERELDSAPGRLKTVDVGDKKVIVHRTSSGRISAIHNACSHAGASLSLGQISDGVVTCPWHDSKFELSNGSVLCGPANYPQPVFEVRVVAGWIELCSSTRG